MIPAADITPPPVIAPACSTSVIAALTAPASADPVPHRLTCFATLPPGSTIPRPLLFEGSEASGAGIDCGGGEIGLPGRTSDTRNPTIAVWSRRQSDGWSRPRDVRLVNCTVHGNLRVWGLGLNDKDGLRASSRTHDHTARLQAAAPSGLRLERITFRATGSIPLYVGPGVTGVQMTGGGFHGRSVSTAVYLDAESAGNIIEGVDFDIATGREQIAVDGSAHNRILGNRFNLRGRGGVFLYRNCGEDGVIRHQPPTDNQITDNRFVGAAWFRARAVVVGSREGRRRYCGADAGWAFGSSIDDGDHATGNPVARNTVLYRWLPNWLQAGRGDDSAP